MTYTMDSKTINLNNRQTFGHGVAGQPLDTIERHIYNQETKAGECGERPDPKQHPLFSYFSIVTRIVKAPMCSKCLEVVK
jgi:hypothetical protein